MNLPLNLIIPMEYSRINTYTKGIDAMPSDDGLLIVDESALKDKIQTIGTRGGRSKLIHAFT